MSSEGVARLFSGQRVIFGGAGFLSKHWPPHSLLAQVSFRSAELWFLSSILNYVGRPWSCDAIWNPITQDFPRGTAATPKAHCGLQLKHPRDIQTVNLTIATSNQAIEVPCKPIWSEVGWEPKKEIYCL